MDYKTLFTVLILIALVLVGPVTAADTNVWVVLSGQPTGSTGGISGNMTRFLTMNITGLHNTSGLMWNQTSFSSSGGYHATSDYSTSIAMKNGSTTFVTGTMYYYHSANPMINRIEILFDDMFDDHGMTGRVLIALDYSEGNFHYTQPAYYLYSASYTNALYSGPDGPNYKYMVGQQWKGTAPILHPPTCSALIAPQWGPAPLNVDIADNSTGDPTSWSWQLYRPGTGMYISSLKNWTTPALEAGLWTVNLTATNEDGSCSISYPAVINATGNGNETIITNLDVKNAITGALIQDAQVGIRNTTSGVWRNGTCPTGLAYFDSTGASFEYPLSLGESITLAASKAGYGAQSTTFTIPYNNYKTYLYLVPDSVTPASGSGTLITTVVDNKHGLPISGATVRIDTGQFKSTNSAGAATFYNVTAGDRTVTASMAGYQTVETTKTITDGETELLTMELVLNGETAVPTYIPTVITTGGYGSGTGNTSAEALNEKGASGIAETLDFLIGISPLILIGLVMEFMKRTFGSGGK